MQLSDVYRFTNSLLVLFFVCSILQVQFCRSFQNSIWPSYNLNIGVIPPNSNFGQYLVPSLPERDVLIANVRNGTVPSFDKNKEEEKVFISIKNSLASLWYRFSHGRKGMLIFLAPSIFNQVSLVGTTLPFVLSHFLQYVDKSTWTLLCLLSTSYIMHLARRLFLATLSFCAVRMLWDLTRRTSPWLKPPLPEDSVAVVNGVGNPLSVAVALRLWQEGYGTLALVDPDQAVLDQVKDLLSKQISCQIETFQMDSNSPLAPIKICQWLQAKKLFHKIDAFISIAPYSPFSPTSLKSNLVKLRSTIESSVHSFTGLLLLLHPAMSKRQRFLPEHLRAASGRIMIISYFSPHHLGHCSLRNALSQFLVSTAQEYRRFITRKGLKITLALAPCRLMTSQVGENNVPGSSTLIMDIFNTGRDLVDAMRFGQRDVTVFSRDYMAFLVAQHAPDHIFQAMIRINSVLTNISKFRSDFKAQDRKYQVSSTINTAFKNFWYQPIINYTSLKQSWMYFKKLWQKRQLIFEIPFDDQEIEKEDVLDLEEEENSLRRYMFDSIFQEQYTREGVHGGNTEDNKQVIQNDK